MRIETLYVVGLRRKETLERMTLLVWAENIDKATESLCGTLIGYKCEYDWTGSCPVYKNKKLVTREVL